MPRFPKFALALVSATPVVALMLPSIAHADTYQLYVVANTQSEHFVMGDDFGDFAISLSLPFASPSPCGGLALFSPCYEVGNVASQAVSYTANLPIATPDPDPKSGHDDLPTGPGWQLTGELGNLFAGYYQAPNGTEKRGIWDGSDPALSYLSDGSLDGGFASANGNVFYIDGFNNTLVVGIDLQTSPVPEPGTLSLTATALLAVTALRRRFFHR